MANDPCGTGNGVNPNYQQGNTNGQGQGPTSPGGPGVEKLLGKKTRWSQLSGKQRARFGSQKNWANMKTDHQNALSQGAKNSSYTTRKAGDKLRDLRQERNDIREAKAAGEDFDAKRLEQINKTMGQQETKIYGDGTGTIADNFDAAAGGAGGKRGTNRVSAKDMRELEQRYGKQAVVDYMNKNPHNANVAGAKAQALLKIKGELILNPDDTIQICGRYKSSPVEDTNPDPVEDTNPIDDGEQTEDTTGGGGTGGDDNNNNEGIIGDGNTDNSNNDGIIGDNDENIINDGNDNNNNTGDNSVVGGDNSSGGVGGGTEIQAVTMRSMVTAMLSVLVLWAVITR